MPCHLLLRVQHEVLHLHVLLPLQSAELLQEVGMLQQRVLSPVRVVLLRVQLLLVRLLRPLLLHLRRHDRTGVVNVIAERSPRADRVHFPGLIPRRQASDRQTPRIEGGARVRRNPAHQARFSPITRSFKRVVRRPRRPRDEVSHRHRSLRGWRLPSFVASGVVTAIAVITHCSAVRRI